MSDKEGALRMQSNRRWAIVRPGRAPYELTSGDVFRVEVDGKLLIIRMEFAHARSGGGACCGGAPVPSEGCVMSQAKQASSD